ncbi:MAG: HD domain-containing protein [Prevotella sp.]|jgi:HD superfamily phosphodiesterase|nr:MULTISPECIES: HD domain-containing protein [unclassified Prevotella]MCH3991298.1 HD domain-containing protein [Prevotella sp.]MCH4100431.1 HD domain-containing protein [Prevotella sp.]MCI1474089.1 HD domain-containing protein [Prevotella sp.]MCI1518937.1 HD domain-containing protein [Prevotella sp.]MCI1549470.1 HD domain-containing protein [Prevotella sp.]
MNIQHAQLIAAMINYDQGDARRIQHFIKVHDFATAIGTLEHIDPDTLFILETAAIVHDIGIHVAEKKYGDSNGKLQEKEGPAEAQKLLEKVGGYTPEQIERVKFLIGHHHTYTNIKGIDYQILVEADFLVNIYEDQLGIAAIENVKRTIFKTKTGTRFLEDL